MICKRNSTVSSHLQPIMQTSVGNCNCKLSPDNEAIFGFWLHWVLAEVTHVIVLETSESMSITSIVYHVWKNAIPHNPLNYIACFTELLTEKTKKNKFDRLGGSLDEEPHQRYTLTKLKLMFATACEIRYLGKVRSHIKIEVCILHSARNKKDHTYTQCMFITLIFKVNCQLRAIYLIFSYHMHRKCRNKNQTLRHYIASLYGYKGRIWKKFILEFQGHPLRSRNLF